MASAPQLLTPTGQPAAGATLDIPARGLALSLRLAQVAPAHLELTSAQLKLGAPAGSTQLVGGGAGLTVVTNLGALSASWTAEQNNDVLWLTADWGARRSLVAIQIDATQADPRLARLKISDGGPWFPPLPVEAVQFNKEQPLPDVVASRLMLEMVVKDSNGVLQPSTNRLKGLTLKLAAQPFDLGVAVGDKPPLYKRAGRLLPDQEALVQDGMVEALNAIAPKDGAAADLPIQIQVALQGRVKITAAQFTAATVYTALDGPVAEGGVPLEWDGQAVGRVSVGDGASLEKVELTVVPDLVPERFAFPSRASAPLAQGQLCDPDHSSAQGFPALAGSLAGFDVLLQPTQAKVSGTLALHPEENGHPAEAPFSGAAFPFQIDELSPQPWAPRWVRVQLPKPLKLDAGRWWLVVTVASGEAIWSIDATAPALGGELLPALLHRLGAGAWAPWDPPPAAPWGLCRLRVSDAAPPPPFQVTLHRNPGAPVLVLVPDEAGRVVAEKKDLAALGTGGATLEIAASSAGASVSGSVRFEGMRIVVQTP